MADEDPDVTVNVTASMESLQKSLDAVPAMVAKAVSGAAGNIDLNVRTPNINMGGPPKATTGTNQFNEGREGNAAQRFGVEIPTIPQFYDPKKQLQALMDTSDELDKLQQQFDKLGLGGSAAANMVASRLDFVNEELEALDKKAEELEGKTSRAPAPKPVKPPPLPKQETVTTNIIDTVSGQGAMAGFTQGLNLLGKSASLNDPHLGRLLGRIRGLGSAFSAATPEIIATVAAVAASIVVVAGVAIAIKKTIDVMEDAVTTASKLELKLIELSGALGSKAKAQVSLKEIQVVTEGTGIDPSALMDLIPTLEAKAHGILNSEGGLNVIVEVASRLDPTRVKDFGNAIAQAADNLTKGGNVADSVEGLVEMGIISGDTAQELRNLGGQGYSNAEMWNRLYQAMLKGGDGADRANKSLGGLMNRLSVGISSTWDQMMEAMGQKAVELLGPSFDHLLSVLESAKPTMIAMASWCGQILSRVAGWIAGVVDGAATALNVLMNMFSSGDLGDFIRLSFTYGMMTAANEFVDAVVVGVQYMGDLIAGAFMMIASGDFWMGIGDYLLSAAYSFIGVLAGLGSTIMDAMSPVLDYISATFAMIGTNLAGVIKMTVASGMAEGKERDDLWNEGKKDWDMTFDQALKDAKDSHSGENAINFTSGLADEAKAEAAGYAHQGDVKIGRSKAKAFEGFDPEKYYKPNILGGTIDNLSKGLDEIIARSSKSREKTKKDLSKKKTPPLKDAFGQGGPNSVVDSLQSVGGGGLSAGTMSIDEKILAENKEQNKHLQDLAKKNTNYVGVGLGMPTYYEDTKTPNVSGAFGGKESDGQSTNTILTSIHSTLQAMLAKMGGGSTSTGSLVSVR